MLNTQIILTYLAQLQQNNNREWYHQHKKQLQDANLEFEGLIRELILGIGQTDGSILHNEPKDLTFKLVRDTRFSHDKSPYNPCFRAHISSAGKLPIPVGYFLSIRPGNRSFLGGGLFASMFKEATERIRDRISEHGDEFQAIIDRESFAENFSVKGEALKKTPAGYDPGHPQAEFFKYKSWYIEHPVTDEQIADADAFIRLAVEKFTLMQPFNLFLNQALAGFSMPKR